MQCVYTVVGLKSNYFTHTLYIIVASICLYETRRFLPCSSFWQAWCALIGQQSSALWLAQKP